MSAAANVFAQRISLLWLTSDQDAPPPNWQDTAPDLELNEIAKALSLHPRYTARILKVLHRLTTDPAVIDYRLAVLEDVLANPLLADALEALLGKIESFDRYSELGPNTDQSIHQVAYRLGELSNYIDCVSELSALLNRAELRSQGLQAVRALANGIEADVTFQRLKRELPELLSKVENIRSVTIGVNLNSQLLPAAATLLSINDFRFKGASSFLNRLFRGSGSEKSEDEGIGQLHAHLGYQEVRTLDSIVIPDEVKRASPLLEPLLKDLGQILDKLSKRIEQNLRDYMKVDIGFMLNIRDDLTFYLGAARLIRRMKACGLPFCRPSVAPIAERVSSLRDLYNLNLALLFSEGKTTDLSQRIVLNDVDFGSEGRIFILTGPNQGGKTVFAQGIGLAHVLFQAGLYVPAASARLSPVDRIFTHFAAVERISQQAGRLGEEARRLSAIFAQATPNSLLLLNESFSSTSAGESLYLARDIVRVMRRLGTRAIYATHLHDLAGQCGNINVETQGDSVVASLVSVMTADGDAARRSYKIIPSPPMGKSYAREIAAQYGISYEQLTAALKARKLIDDE
jgi:DNA mismatch repair protein MutS